jgi:hypothetical protein
LVLGYLFTRRTPSVLVGPATGAAARGALIVGGAATSALRRHFMIAENRAAAVRWMDEHRATRWIVVASRRFSPQLRFLWNRVTPGGTFGLEFTSLMAALAVASFVLVAYTVIVGEDPGPTRGDVTAFDVVEHLRGAWLVDIAKVVTALGSGFAEIEQHIAAVGVR